MMVMTATSSSKLTRTSSFIPGGRFVLRTILLELESRLPGTLLLRDRIANALAARGCRPAIRPADRGRLHRASGESPSSAP